MTQLGPAVVNMSFDCGCRYESRGLVLGAAVDERGTYEVTREAIVFERQTGQMMTLPYRLDGERLMLAEHPTETYTYERVAVLACDGSAGGGR